MSLVRALLLLSWLEHRRPLRRSVEPKLRREVRNLSVAGVSAIAVVLAERPIVMPLAALVQNRNWGLLRLFGLPLWMEICRRSRAHGLRFLRLARPDAPGPIPLANALVHHVDLDLDASTALRFHFTEMLASIPWRAGQVLVIGLTPFSFSVWQCVFLLSILFHHSNVELPVSTERWLNRLIVTPRMHGIHHSIVERETNANWSSGLTVWDWLHGTLRLNVPQSEVTIGVPAFREPESVTFPRIIAMPFEHLPPIWELPTGGAPQPHRSEAPLNHLAAVIHRMCR